MLLRCIRKTVVATIDGEVLKRSTREFVTFMSSLTELKDWLLDNGITNVAMESTSVYWRPVYYVLEHSGMKAWIVNACHVKNVPGHKTDKKDSVGSVNCFWQDYPDQVIFHLRSNVNYVI